VSEPRLCVLEACVILFARAGNIHDPRVEPMLSKNSLKYKTRTLA